MSIQDNAAPAGGSATSRDDLAGMFLAELQAEDAPAPAPDEPAKAEEPQQQNDAAPVEAAAEETSSEDVTAEAETEIEPTEAHDIADAPSGMSEADKAHFAKLSPELRAWVSKREGERHADYTRKSQEVAEVRKEATTRIQALSGAMQQYDAILAKFTDHELSPPDPAMRMSDPEGFEHQMAAYVQAKHQQEIAAKERQRNAENYAALQKQQQQEWYAEQGQRLREIAPELADASPKGRELMRSVWNYGLKNGYSKEQLTQAGASDMAVLMKAMRYDAAKVAKQAAKPAAAPAAPKVQQPGPSKAAGGRPSNLAKAVQNLNASGTRESLAASYLALIQSER